MEVGAQRRASAAHGGAVGQAGRALGEAGDAAAPSLPLRLVLPVDARATLKHRLALINRRLESIANMLGKMAGHCFQQATRVP